MISQEKIESWIQEALERPESVAQIIQQIARRLAELTNRNESLLAENILLKSGEKVEEYERRITHLEYQLDLLKRQFGGELPAADQSTLATSSGEPEKISLLIYDGSGRILRHLIEPTKMEDGLNLGSLTGSISSDNPPRLLAVREQEELLFIFSSGRIATLSTGEIPMSNADAQSLDWEQAPLPSEPNAGEQLACLAPISHLALVDYFLQASRKGYLKKIRTSLAESILANRYIGTGIKQAPDQTFSLTLCREDDRLALVSAEGYLQCLEVKTLAPSVDEALRLDVRDHLVSVFIPQPGQSIAVMTQVGKVVHWTEDRLEIPRSFRTRGQALYSASRRSQGIRVVQAASVGEADWGIALHSSGQLSLHQAKSLLQMGAIEVHPELLAFSFFSPSEFNSGGVGWE